MTWREVFEAVVIVTVTLNVIVSLAICLNKGLTWRQKAGQVALTWIVPVLGALLLGIFMWTQRGSAPATGYPSAHNGTSPGLCMGTGQFPPSTGGS